MESQGEIPPFGTNILIDSSLASRYEEIYVKTLDSRRSFGGSGGRSSAHAVERDIDHSGEQAKASGEDNIYDLDFSESGLQVLQLSVDG